MLRGWRQRRTFERLARAAAGDVAPQVQSAEKKLAGQAQAVSNSLARALARLEPEQPVCPKCGAGMVIRVAKKRAYNGARFWGCRRYPACHGLVELERFPEAAMGVKR